VVVRPQHEPRCPPATDRPHRLDGRLDRLRFGEEVPGDHGHVDRRERREEPGLLRVAADEVEIRQVQDRERMPVAIDGSRRKDVQGVPTEPEPGPLDRDAVDDAPDADEQQERDDDGDHGGPEYAG
jgi:hypothetical protein